MVCYAGLLIKLLAAQLKWQYPYYNMAYSSFRERIIFFLVYLHLDLLIKRIDTSSLKRRKELTL